MTTENGLSLVERTAARMFFNVSIQSAFALEDPNSRFGIEFQNAEAREVGNAKSMDKVVHKLYESDIGEGRITLETNPPNNPALSRVIVKGGGAVVMIDSVLNGLKSAEYFTPVEQRPLDLIEEAPVDANIGNRMVRLVISDQIKADHDVAALFSWSAGSDKRIILEMMAWPISKTAELRT